MGEVEFERKIESRNELAKQLLRTEKVEIAGKGLMEILDVAANLLLFNLRAVADQVLRDGVLQAGFFVVCASLHKQSPG